MKMGAFSMFGSMSEFLSTFAFRSQGWCFLELGEGQGLRTPHADAAYCYVVIEGEITVAGIEGKEFTLSAGQIGFVVSGEAHCLRPQGSERIEEVSLLQNGGHVDIPPTITLGRGRVVARILCARLKVRWPTGHRPRGMPAYLTLAFDHAPIKVENLLGRPGLKEVQRCLPIWRLCCSSAPFRKLGSANPFSWRPNGSIPSQWPGSS